MIEVLPTAIEAVKLIAPRRIADGRGFFSEVYGVRAFAEAGIDTPFVQDNHSLSVRAGTVRGLHFQSPPHAQAKLVRVTRGRVLDVAVDLRRSSVAYGRHVAAELSADNWRQLFIPAGFAHGFCTLEPDTEIVYKVSAPYAATNDLGLAFDDPALGIDWPVRLEDATLSDKDRRQPRLADLPRYFD